ncbi:DUF6302 family protein [Streptomyces chrestomyceticus]|uniref:DUF6302 family protein n=1 Tax=Streptomyces chrestomyceticus TaxID=68185 RepID=UPI0033EED72B
MPPTDRVTFASAEDDLTYFRDRLADAALLDNAVALEVPPPPFLLAVPVGGRRRGGYASYGLVSMAVAAHDLLTGRDGFPDLRIRWSPDSDTCHVVEWGDPVPLWWQDDVVAGRFYGYSEAAIAAYVQQDSPADSSARRGAFA